MSTTAISIPTDAMHDIVAKAVLDSISADQREVLIKAALDFLITPPKKENYHAATPPSPLQQAFHNAVAESAREIVRQVVKDELAERIKAVIHEQMVDAVATNSLLASGIGFAVGEQVEKALRGEFS